ncbi:HU family DNA-binding protein [Deinococcus sp. QL22]|uniref:HU family DNA-binding protein n=1 Tax=Deinococcus sp. QL22 TaxID=2939437 RepID=UPI002016C722|nr:HU family DNA-binding protein [Deinococcus sp. QL22]UQN07467.1 HU family DNA-binding protein [Deinococcus sp. QL22]
MTKSTKPAAKKPAASKTAPKGTGKASNTATAPADASKVAKTQIIDLVADATSLSKKQAAEAVSSMLDLVVAALKDGKSVGLPGLGTLSVAATAERQGVRPGTSDKITIPAGKKVRFKVASTLKGTL